MVPALPRVCEGKMRHDGCRRIVIAAGVPSLVMLIAASLLSPRSSEAESNMSSAIRPEPRRTEGSACFLPSSQEA